MVEIKVDNINLRQIAESGQAFRWNQQEKYAGYQGVMQQYLFAYIRKMENKRK